jgi:hypothetical protein
MGDLDGDGDLELISANSNGDSVAVFFQRSPGVFATPPVVLDPTPISDVPFSIVAADLDGDGNLDLASANFGSDRLTVFFQSSPGLFATPALVLDPTSGPDQPLSIVAADLDGDGDLELISANNTSDGVTAFFQTFPGSFAAPLLALDPTAGLDRPFSVAAADLDGDGDLELVSANDFRDRVTVFWGGR